MESIVEFCIQSVRLGPSLLSMPDPQFQGKVAADDSGWISPVVYFFSSGTGSWKVGLCKQRFPAAVCMHNVMACPSNRKRKR
jgi:hypothetical protein